MRGRSARLRFGPRALTPKCRAKRQGRTRAARRFPLSRGEHPASAQSTPTSRSRKPLPRTHSTQHREPAPVNRNEWLLRLVRADLHRVEMHQRLGWDTPRGRHPTRGGRHLRRGGPHHPVRGANLPLPGALPPPRGPHPRQVGTARRSQGLPAKGPGGSSGQARGVGQPPRCHYGSKRGPGSRWAGRHQHCGKSP